MVVKLIKIPHTFKGKDGKEIKGYNYAIVSENGTRVYVNAAFKEDYGKLSVLAESEI